MNIIKVLAALGEISKRCVVAEVDPEAVDVNLFTGHGGHQIVRGRGWKNGVLMTFDVYLD